MNVQEGQVILTSVPHSGTQFTQQLLAQKVGWVFDHLYISVVPILRRHIKAGVPCIVPIRHPVMVALSYKARRMGVEQMVDYWRRLVLAIDPLDPIYLPLDTRDREDWLARADERLGRPGLTTDWKPRGSCGEKGRFVGRDEEIVYGLFDELRDFFEGKFGYVEDVNWEFSSRA